MKTPIKKILNTMLKNIVAFNGKNGPYMMTESAELEVEEAEQQLIEYFESLIGEDEYHWNCNPNGIVMDLLMSDEMETKHNLRIDTRNDLRAEIRAKLRGI